MYRHCQVISEHGNISMKRFVDSSGGRRALMPDRAFQFAGRALSSSLGDALTGIESVEKL